ncbi:MAG TPA: SBBP repeat-containing protein, partial [bacterium]|nr:SBBP repeat-containing protein [bacterium]
MRKSVFLLVAFLSSPTALWGASGLQVPVLFIENRGQVDPGVGYYTRGKDKSLYFGSQGMTFSLWESPRQDLDLLASFSEPSAGNEGQSFRWNVRVDFVGADAKAMPIGQDSTPAIFSYFKGPRSDWKTGLKTYASLKYPDLWKGIDLLYTGHQDRVEYRFIVRPGADPRRIRLAYRGGKVTLNERGQLEIETPAGGFEDGALRVYQEREGKKEEVAANFRLERGSEESIVGFEVGAYDRTRPLIIDPEVLIFSGFIGGSGADRGEGVAVDGSGNVYVVGRTGSTEASFPVLVGPDLTSGGNGNGDAFVAKVAADGTSLIYAGFIAGASSEIAHDIAVDTSGNAYVAGGTGSFQTSFPVTVGPDLTANGGFDAFVMKIAPDGASLVYSGYIGGSGNDQAYGIAVDASGNAYVAGETGSTEATFPVVVGPDLTANGMNEAFVAKVAPDGASLVYAGFIGGSNSDFAFDNAIDASGNQYVTGNTSSTETTNFPVTIGPDLTFNGGFNDAFVAKVSADGTSLVYAGFIGGNDFDEGDGIAVDAAGNAYVTGFTESTEPTFPVVVGPDLTANGGVDNGYLTKVSPDGASLIYSGFIGGSDDDEAFDVAVDASGSAYVTGLTRSTESSFPIKGGPDLTANGLLDAFVAKVAPGGDSFDFSGFIGGSGDDRGLAIVLDGNGNAYVTGETDSPDTSFPAIAG